MKFKKNTLKIIIVFLIIIFSIGFSVLSIKYAQILNKQTNEPVLALKQPNFTTTETLSMLNSNQEIDITKFKIALMKKFKYKLDNLDVYYDLNNVVVKTTFNDKKYTWYYSLNKL